MFPSVEELRKLARGLEEIQQRLAPHFERAEPRAQAMSYLRGLLSTTERKNGWHLAELAGATTPDSVQRLLNHAHWDEDRVRDDLQAYVLAHLERRSSNANLGIFPTLSELEKARAYRPFCDYLTGALADPQAVLAIDETGFVKKGKKSAGVAPQYSGTVGKIANCQIGVYLTYATKAGGVLIDRDLYLPKEWTVDPERCKEAGIPEGSQTIPKPTMAKSMLERAFAHGIQAAWVTGDTVYGGDTKLRRFLEERLQAYVLAVPANQRIGLTHRADEVVAVQPSDQWQRLSAGEGSQGPRWYDWIWVELSFRWTEPGWKQWLLCRCSISRPDELAYYLVFAPETVTLQQVVQAAGTRWRIEEDFELGKQQVGLDEYEVRKYQAWYRHQTLALFALAFLTVLKVQAQKRGTSISKTQPSFSR